MDADVSAQALERWLAALEQRHLANLTPSEVARALRALSSCYVERRAKLAHGGALDTAGKRAAFALFYAPLHFLVVREIIRALPDAGVTQIVDVGCGTGAAGAAWALEIGGARVRGIDRNRWAIAEANWTYAQLGLPGRASRDDVTRLTLRSVPGSGVLAAYTINELSAPARLTLLDQLLRARRQGARVLVIEPIAKRMSGWWSQWEQAFEQVAGVAQEWRFAVPLPPRQWALGRAAGLDPRELTARSLWL
ncbi:MAG: methyltransferase domain-containing protein [Acidobacteria bacterium]|nr:methyltransferase domain-containing protein [Acidobacteriota bacterium]